MRAQYLVYFSSVTNNTTRFVEKIGIQSTRIPIKGDSPVMDSPYILITPTYGSSETNPSRSIPPQVRTFLNIKQNRKNLCGVISSGNINFGEDYCKAGKVISAKAGVPHLYTFELMGTEDDVKNVQAIFATADFVLPEETL